MVYRQTIFEEWTHAHEAARRGRKTSALSVVALAHLADMILRVELKAELVDEIELRFEEIDVAFLVRHPRRAFAREELLERVWGYRYGDTSTVTVHVRRLREKIEPDPADPVRIETVWGVGYRWEGVAPRPEP